jgi:hypothetical protein
MTERGGLLIRRGDEGEAGGDVCKRMPDGRLEKNNPKRNGVRSLYFVLRQPCAEIFVMARGRQRGEG